jgi:hypothetical protein
MDSNRVTWGKRYALIAMRSRHGLQRTAITGHTHREGRGRERGLCGNRLRETGDYIQRDRWLRGSGKVNGV